MLGKLHGLVIGVITGFEGIEGKKVTNIKHNLLDKMIGIGLCKNALNLFNERHQNNVF